MSQEEPIEIGFIINSPEVLQQAMQVEKGLKGVDDAVARSEKNFKEYIETQLQANKAMLEGVKLSEAQKRAYDTYTNILSGLKDMMSQTTDPTQLSVYKFKIEEVSQSIQTLLEKANNKTPELINTNKLEEAGRLLDSISDKAFNPTFASGEELEILSEAINKAESEFEQLGVVIDFVKARLETVDDKETFIALKQDIETANTLLGRNVEKYDATGNSINQMQDALKLFQEQLVSETDTEKIVTLNRNIEELENSIRQVAQAGRTGFDEFGNSIAQPKESVRGLKGQLAELVQKLAHLRIEGKQNTEAYKELTRQATELSSALSTVNEEVRHSSSATSNLDTLIRATKGVASGYALAKSASSLFGTDQSNIEQSILRVTSAMSLLQSLQVVQAELERKDSIATKTLTYLKGLYAKSIGQTTGALKAFRVALLASGIGIAIVLLGELIANWDKVKRAIGLTSDELERNQAIGKKANDLYGERIAKLQLLVSTNKAVVLTEQQKKQAVKDFNKDFSDTLGTVKDYADLETRIINNAPKYVEYLQIKAQADASYMLSLEKQKNLLEQINALSTGDLKWYDQLQDKTDKIFETAWNLFGAGIDTKRDISQSEILNIIGLPDDKEFDSVISSYSSVIQGKLRNFRKTQGADKGMLEASFDLQRQAGELAKQYDINPKDKESDDKSKKVFQDKIKALAEIKKAEDNFNKSRLTGLEKDLKDIEQRYAKLREDALKAQLDAKAIERINNLEKKEKVSASYTNASDALKKRLEEEKDLYKYYEELKTQIGSKEVLKRFEGQFNGVTDFKSRLQQEINEVEKTPEKQRMPEQEARLKVLKDMLSNVNKETQKDEDSRYLKAYQATLSYNEKLQDLEIDYQQKRALIHTITDDQIKADKLALLESQRKQAVDSITEQSYDEQRLAQDNSTVLIGITRQQLRIRLESLKEYYKSAEASLTDDQKKLINKEIGDAESVLGGNDNQTKKNALLLRKKQLLELITNLQKKGVQNVKEELRELENINQELEVTDKDRIQKIAEWGAVAADAFSMIGDSISDINPDLADQLQMMSEIVGVASELGTAIASGNALGIAQAGIKVVGTVLNWQKKARESERKANEEIKKWQDEIFASQLEYNRLLRDRVVSEATINSLYESRATNIKKEMEALEKNKNSVERDMNNVFERLLNADTVVGKEKKKSGGVLGIGRKTKVVDVNKKVAELLDVAEYRDPSFFEKIFGAKPFEGVKEGIELTDELYDELERLNGLKPFTGDAKEAFEQLKKLKDEYGSINDAMISKRQELLNITVGTTADAIADSIRQGVAQGKTTFEDFADDIEGLLRNAILQGLLTNSLQEGVQKLQEELALLMEDGELTDSDAEKIREMYMNIVKESQEKLDALNKAGIDLGQSNDANSLKGAIKGMSEQQADLMAGQIGGWRLAQLETNSILSRNFSSMLEFISRQVAIQMQIEINTRNTSTNTERTVKELQELNSKIKQTKSEFDTLKSAGVWTP